MSIDRPTFNESWYRVMDLTPRLHSAVNVHRQHFRGILWFVLQNPANGRYVRLGRVAYHFTAMLDGRRAVGDVWQICLDRFGDTAPTQGEVIQLLCQLHASNLLQGNLAPDALALFKRHRKRVWRELHSAVGNLFFIRIPLWDPDRFLDRWAGMLGRIFSTPGLVLWAGLLLAGLLSLAGRGSVLAQQVTGVLNPGNLPLLYAAILMSKLLHEFGHAFACKHFGRKTGTGGEVHQMGLTLLFFTPLPFVDASSAWALRNKWHRIMVGASGMIAESAFAALAAIVWARTADGSTVHVIAYNIMLIAGISSLAFNGNPFLRYDAYYILLDLLEIPNLESRSKLYIAYLVKRYLWGVDKAPDPSHTTGERRWLVFYAMAATVCRAFILAAIALMLMKIFVIPGTLLALVLLARWAFSPMLRLIRFLTTHPDLERHRTRAWLTCALVTGLLMAVFGRVQMPDRVRIEGVVEPGEFAVIRMKTTGRVRSVLESGSNTAPDGPALVVADSPVLEAERDQLLAEHRRLQVSRQAARTKEAAAVQIMDEKMAALREQIQRTQQNMDALTLRSPISGVWVAPDSHLLTALRLDQGRRIGVVAKLDRLRIRAVARQQVASRLIEDARPQVEIKVKNRPDIELTGHIEKIIPAGQAQLPSAALGYGVGGGTRVDLDDTTGRKAAVPFFEIVVVPSGAASAILRPGQTMAIRFETSAKPLAVQVWRTLLQLFQKGQWA